jgi:hypothetical protein
MAEWLVAFDVLGNTKPNLVLSVLMVMRPAFF